MKFEEIRLDEIPSDIKPAKGLSKYSELKSMIAELPLGKAIKIELDGMNPTTLKSNFSNWASQLNCYMTHRHDRRNGIIYLWKLEKAK